MKIGDRIREERERLGLSQTEMAEIADVSKRTQIDWEKGVSSPNAEALAALAVAGMDVRYVITSAREYKAPAPLSLDERRLITLYKAAESDARSVALKVLASGDLPKPPKTAKTPGTRNSGVQITNNDQGSIGSVHSYTLEKPIRGGVTINAGGVRKAKK